VQDLIFIAVILAFFASLWLFIGACERIIGSDEEAFAGAEEPTEPSAPTGQEKLAA
jgi:hypothetical protein